MAQREVSNIRASGSYIRGTNGHSNGLVPMLRNFNETARYVDQGANAWGISHLYDLYEERRLRYQLISNMSPRVGQIAVRFPHFVSSFFSGGANKTSPDDFEPPN